MQQPPPPSADAQPSESLELTVAQSEHKEAEDFSGDNYVAPDMRDPPLSPRDKLSYQEDKKAWKEMQKFQSDNPQLSKLVFLMQMAIFKAKPQNIVAFLCDEFFTERHQLQLRKELGLQEG